MTFEELEKGFEELKKIALMLQNQQEQMTKIIEAQLNQLHPLHQN